MNILTVYWGSGLRSSANSCNNKITAFTYNISIQQNLHLVRNERWPAVSDSGIFNCSFKMCFNSTFDQLCTQTRQN